MRSETGFSGASILSPAPARCRSDASQPGARARCQVVTPDPINLETVKRGPVTRRASKTWGCWMGRCHSPDGPTRVARTWGQSFASGRTRGDQTRGGRLRAVKHRAFRRVARKLGAVSRVANRVGSGRTCGA